MRLSVPHATTFLILLPFLSGVLSDPQLPLPAQSGFRRAQHLRKKSLLGGLLGGVGIGTTASEAAPAAPETANMAAGGLDSRSSSGGLLGGLVGDLTGQSVTSLATLPASSTTMAPPTGVVTTGLITAQAGPSSSLSSAIPLVTANATSSSTLHIASLVMNATLSADEPTTSTYTVVVEATPTGSARTGNLNSSGSGRSGVGVGWMVALGAAAVLSF